MNKNYTPKKGKITAYDAVSFVLRAMARRTFPGRDIAEIDAHAGFCMSQVDATSVNKGYLPKSHKVPYPAFSCINVNHVIAHGVPHSYILHDGDIVSFDLGIRDADGNCGDAALTVGVGTISPENEKLLRYTKQTLYAGIREIRAGVNTRVITQAMERHALSRGLKMNRRFAGHGIGKDMHMWPNIYNIDEPANEYVELVEGQVLCLEPICTYGKDTYGIVSPDGWTTFTSDGKNSAIFEHMIEVMVDGYKILTTHIEED